MGRELYCGMTVPGELERIVKGIEGFKNGETCRMGKEIGFIQCAC